MKLSFAKMHGLGNDFAIFDGRNQDISKLTKEMIVELSDRKIGIGCDQFIVLESSDRADAFMRIYNPDGDQAESCGNAARCVGRLICNETGENKVTLDTVVGLRHIEKQADGLYTASMGEPKWGWQDIPLSEEQDTLSLALPLEGVQQAVAVNVGNPHVVFFVDDLKKIKLEEWGAAVEMHTMFPERTNVEFVQVISRNELRMRVWERGAGVTRACGSGSCATLVAGVRAGKASREAKVILDGGELLINWDEGSNIIFMTGSATEVYRGTLDV